MKKREIIKQLERELAYSKNTIAALENHTRALTETMEESKVVYEANVESFRKELAAARSMNVWASNSKPLSPPPLISRRGVNSGKVFMHSLIAMSLVLSIVSLIISSVNA